MRKEYDTKDKPYIELTHKIDVRFSEVDAMRVVWHGHYLAYCEDARVAFGKRYGLDYQDFEKIGFAAPIVHASVDYLASAKYGDNLSISIRMYKNLAAKLEYTYEIKNTETDKMLATAHTIQVFTSFEGELYLALPDFMRTFYAKHFDKAERT